VLFKHKYKSPIGDIGLLAEFESLLSISFTNPDFEGLEATLSAEQLSSVVSQLNQYFYEGRKSFDIYYKLDTSNFRKTVYETMKQIPYGTTVTYKELAINANSPNAFRAVGTTCGKNPLPIIIPCHRVTSVNGIGGYTGGLNIKRFLLNLEKN